VTLLRLPSFMKTSLPRFSLSRTLAPRALWAASKRAVAPLLKRRQRGVRWAASCTGQRRRPSKPSADHLVRSDLDAAVNGSNPAARWMSSLALSNWQCHDVSRKGVVMVVLGVLGGGEENDVQGVYCKLKFLLVFCAASQGDMSKACSMLLV